MNLLIIFSLLLSAHLSFGHARLKTPVPRNNNAGIKVGPCGGLPRSANPMVVTGGQAITVQWEETINHPGKFIFSLSRANDQGFQNEVLAMVIDDQNLGNNLPHQYQTTITLPDIDCPTCTLQMIQSMEENVSMPTFYYSCADLNIRPSTAPVPVPNPTPTPIETIQNSTLKANEGGIKFGQGCGTLKAVSTKQEINQIFLHFMLMLIPYFAWIAFRRLSSSSFK